MRRLIVCCVAGLLAGPGAASPAASCPWPTPHHAPTAPQLTAPPVVADLGVQGGGENVYELLDKLESLKAQREAIERQECQARAELNERLRGLRRRMEKAGAAEARPCGSSVGGQPVPAFGAGTGASLIGQEKAKGFSHEPTPANTTEPEGEEASKSSTRSAPVPLSKAPPSVASDELKDALRQILQSNEDLVWTKPNNRR
jgi:hypothetical protein